MSDDPRDYTPTRCPMCWKLLETSTPISDPAATPQPGDASICYGCGGFLIFGKDGRPRKPYVGEIDAFAASNPRGIRMLRAAQRRIQSAPIRSAKFSPFH